MRLVCTLDIARIALRRKDDDSASRIRAHRHIHIFFSCFNVSRISLCCRVFAARRDDLACLSSFPLYISPKTPNLYNSEAEQSFRNIMERHVQRTQTPTIFIFSDVSEGKHRPEDLERLIPTRVLYSPSVNILHINPVTKSQMKRCLRSIAKAEGLEGIIDADFYEEIHSSSGGDLRHAIFAMQFRYRRSDAAGTRSGHGNGNGNVSVNCAARKDSRLSAFHALGKLLYAKRKQRQPSRAAAWASVAVDASPPPAGGATLTSWDDGRGPLEFVPEEVLSRTDMGLDSAITFLSYHSPDFFTDIVELSRSCDLMSDSVTFIRRLFDGRQQGDGPFPMDYASCIGGRAVARANVHPAPPRFRQFSAPKVFSVMRKSRENETKIERLRKRLSSGRGGGGALGQEKTSLRDNIGSAHQFVTESLPYIRIVIPQGTNVLCLVRI
ncbi:hypothetical protein ACHAW5_001371 [Stephanodiscus triporus]|uniref:Uncharacterized protein n=1 Tax=Stephanodiscus triporus TaxID=2934178 RepID=A0ABD3PIH3_9STRA